MYDEGGLQTGFSVFMHLTAWHIDGLMHERRNSIADTLELRISYRLVLLHAVTLVISLPRFTWLSDVLLSVDLYQKYILVENARFVQNYLCHSSRILMAIFSVIQTK